MPGLQNRDIMLKKYHLLRKPINHDNESRESLVAEQKIGYTNYPVAMRNTTTCISSQTKRH
jgi:hypothetical protein